MALLVEVCVSVRRIKSYDFIVSLRHLFVKSYDFSHISEFSAEFVYGKSDDFAIRDVALT